MAAFNYGPALEKGFRDLRARDAEALATLGARVAGEGRIELPVLNGAFEIDPAAETVASRDGTVLGVPWKVLAIHYLLSPVPVPPTEGWTGFSDITEARTYNCIYRARVIERLCGTAGRTREDFERASLSVGGERAEWGDAGFRYRVFPRLSVGIAWFGGDEDLGPGASFLYQDNVRSLLVPEDMIVLAESVVGRLAEAAFRKAS